ncbi:MAG: sugar transferase [Pseudomonadota bacterium]
MQTDKVERPTLGPYEELFAGVGGAFYVKHGKRIFDVAISLMLLPIVGAVALGLAILNPIFSPGGLFYVQQRMGHRCLPFRAIKFRTMTANGTITRGADAPLETERITKLGALLRKTRVDELPQIINVLRGEMSLIGPRPDYITHARHYLRVVPGYRKRHDVLPGISGLAQTEIGYVSSIEETRDKVAADLRYIRELDFKMDFYVFKRTLQTVLSYRGQ